MGRSSQESCLQPSLEYHLDIVGSEIIAAGSSVDVRDRHTHRDRLTTEPSAHALRINKRRNGRVYENEHSQGGTMLSMKLL